MEDESATPDRLDSIADFYGRAKSGGGDRLMNALQTWDHAEYLPLRAADPELYGLICNQVGYEIDILLGEGSVKLVVKHREIELTWNGDEEDLLDLVLEGAALVTQTEPPRPPPG